MQTQLIVTEDGSHSLFVPSLNEHYHSTHGAIQESMYVYIDAGMRANLKPELNILEVGFGTGLNALLTFIESENYDLNLKYTSLELYPLELEEVKLLNYSKLLSTSKDFDVYASLHLAKWDEWSEISSHFYLNKIKIDFTNPNAFSSVTTYDIIYFDAFAPEKQPEMWTQDVFNKLYEVCSQDGVITTYCAKGEIRRRMQKSGFTVERLPGPPGKREILRGRKKH